MASIEILVGTTLGGAEYVADELAAELQQQGHTTTIHLAADLAQLDPDKLWLIVSSTHGAGDLPDNLQPLYQQLIDEESHFSQLEYVLCAIGDSSYDTFCEGPQKLADLLEQKGATAFVDKIQIDVQRDPVPEDAAVAWLRSWIGDL
ncbi:FMN-binding protein MioC [Shewanella yunxiaonensis]|uniref:FMN-binding protein MioC n=1 Tax=Shewanella yunxiaonensis TaxID=2829809 RepID=A0ABX7YU67_9GAMM|nr:MULTISPECIES: FMN-binding protein MioC [Shewanella]MDF0535341.1 FMN-binding protein MioC [Shewanella sp. A32]QUN05915.1 FMN-binding protein MioC [Shewanella yunxiaonensis]